MSAPFVSRLRSLVLSLIYGRTGGHPIADNARLIGGSELLRHHSGGSGDAADKTDVRQLADPLCHLLQVCEGLRCAQVAR